LLCKVPIFFIRRLGSRRIYQKEKKKVGGVSFKKIGNDVIAPKAVMSFKQVARHRMAFFKVKSTCSSGFPKNIT
jgi:hypothetical protein